MTFKKTATLCSIVGLVGFLSACAAETYPVENKTYTKELTSTFTLKNESGVEVNYEVEPLDRIFFFHKAGGHGCVPIYHNKNDNRGNVKDPNNYYVATYNISKMDYSLTGADGSHKGTIAAGAEKKITITEKIDIAYSVAKSEDASEHEFIRPLRKLENIRAKVKVYETDKPNNLNYDYYISDDAFDTQNAHFCLEAFSKTDEIKQINHYAFADLNRSNQLGAADKDSGGYREILYRGQADQVKAFGNNDILKIQKVYPQKVGKYAGKYEDYYYSGATMSTGELDFKILSMINDTSVEEKDKVLGVVEE